MQVLGCLQQELDLKGPFWNVMAVINNHFEYVGYSIIGFFAVTTLCAVLYVTCSLP